VCAGLCRWLATAAPAHAPPRARPRVLCALTPQALAAITAVSSTSFLPAKGGSEATLAIRDALCAAAAAHTLHMQPVRGVCMPLPVLHGTAHQPPEAVLTHTAVVAAAGGEQELCWQLPRARPAGHRRHGSRLFACIDQVAACCNQQMQAGPDVPCSTGFTAGQALSAGFSTADVVAQSGASLRHLRSAGIRCACVLCVLCVKGHMRRMRAPS
jgi:hypothetical protein